MALTPLNETHALQIQAGILGRKAGHSFEECIAESINALTYPVTVGNIGNDHVFIGDPGLLLLRYVAANRGLKTIGRASAISTGALATSEEGKQWLTINGINVSRCKSDLVLILHADKGLDQAIGISVKQCNNKSPTNAQLFFTTARGFVALLRANSIHVPESALKALRQFCGDVEWRPLDNPSILKGRRIDPRRFFWEEIDRAGRRHWETIFSVHQDDITRLLLQKAYLDDPFVPEYLIHKTKKAASWIATEAAIYSSDELVTLSRAYGGFSTEPYSVRKGSHKDPPGVKHLAPRFGAIQMQRGGQAQHPEQLQFNLKSGYFYKLG